MRFYTTQKGILYHADSIADLLKQLPTVPDFNQRYLTDYFLNGFFASSDNLFETLFEGIYRIPIGYQLKVKSETPFVERAWSLKEPIENARKLPFTKTLELFKKKLVQAVDEALPTSKPAAVELSGGLDSSSIAAFACTSQEQANIVAFTHGIPSLPLNWMEQLTPTEKKTCTQSFYDETRWSKRVANALDLEHHILTQSSDYHALIERYTEALGGFTEVLFPLLNHRVFETCQSLGIQILLSGFGGDEVVSQHAKLYLKELQARKAYLKLFYEKIRGKKTADYLRLLKIVEPKQSVWKKSNEHLEYLCLPELLRDSTPLPQHANIQAREYDFIEGALSLHWQRRIETSQIIAKDYGIDYHCPLSNPDLMRFFHHLPSSYKYRHGKGRYLMRRSVDKLLPSSIVWRNDKGGATAPAAWFNLLRVLPELFLSRITPDYTGVLENYVNIPKLIKRIEHRPVVNSALVRLIVAILMIAHLEHHIKN